MENTITPSIEETKEQTAPTLGKIAELNSLDKEFLDYTKGNLSANPEESFKWLDDWSERRFGIRGEKGSAWLGSRKEYPNPNAYADALTGLVTRGYEAIATPEYNAYIAAEKSGNREEMIKAAGISLTKRGANIADTISPIESQSVRIADIPKTDEEIDNELKEYGRKIKLQNFSAHFLSFADDFTPDEKEIVYASLRHGDGLPAEKEADYLAVWRDNPEKAARLHYLVELSRKNESAWMRDNLVHPFVTGIENIRYGIGDELGDFAEFQGAISAMKEIVSRDGERRMWNEAERETYRKLVKTEAQNPFAGRIERMGLGPREIVDGMCAKRMAREALPREEQLKRRKEELMLRLATSHKPYDEYNPVSNAISGAIGTIPYMATASVPYAGIAINTLAQFGNVRNDILLNGGNPDEGIGTQFLLAAGWSAIEKQQFLTLAKPLTGLQKKAILERIAQTAWKNGKLGVLGSAIRQGIPEFVAKTFAECIEEGLQGAVEGGTKQWWMPEEKGGGDWTKTISAALTQGGKDFVESIGTMGLLSLVGGGLNQTQARRNALSAESLVDYSGKRLQVMNILSGRVKEMVDEKNIPANAQKMHNEVAQIWEAHKGNAVAALDEMREKYGLADDQARTIGDYLDLRSTLLNIAKTSETDQEATAIAAFAGGAYRVGQTTGMGDTAYDVTDLFRMISPNITVEDIEVDDKTKAPVASPAVENLRQERDAAIKRVEEAKVGSQRKAAERELRRINKKLKAAEAKENAVSYPKMTMRRVTIPVGKNGETRSFVIREDNEAPDIHSKAYAQSAADAVKGAEGLKAGEKVSLQEFKALGLADKLKIAVTQEQYLSMSNDERVAYVSKFGLGGSGNFALLDNTGKEIFNSDAIVSLFRGKTGTPGARIGGNWSLAHEYTHGIVRFLRDIDAIDEGTVSLMRRLFGEPTSDNELWNEEAMANGFAEFLRGEFDFKRLTPEERREAMGFFERVWDIIKDFFRRIFGKEIDEPPVVANTRKEAERAVFNALRNGDLSGLDQYAGIEFEEEKEDVGVESASSREVKHAQDAQKAPSKPSEGKPANEPPKSEERAPAASTPSNTTKDAPKEPAKAKTTPTATPTAATDIAAVVEQIENPIATAANLPARTNTKMTVFTPGYEMEIECEMMWVPLDELAESTDDREVQMRDRTRRATDEQVRSKTRKGVFQPLALFPKTKSDDGAPIIGGGMKIISGHGRKRMLEQLAAEGRFNEYLSAINAEAVLQGAPTAPEGMENPVLVLRVTGGLDKKSDLNRFAELSNRWGGLERSGAELAESDARKITDTLLRLYNPDSSGNLLAASNRDFMTAFLKEVGATGLTNADGTPTPEAALRVQRALMTAIFGNDEKIRAIIQNLLEKSGELSLGNLQNALIRSAGELLAMRRNKGSFDIVNDVREAAYHYIAWRSAQQKQKSLSFADYLNEQDMFAEVATPMQAALAKLLEAGRFGTVLGEYSKLVAQEAVDAQGTFDFAEKRTPLQLLGYAERNTLAPEETPVTPDPTSAKAAEPVQTPPAVSEEELGVRSQELAVENRGSGREEEIHSTPTTTPNLTTAQSVITPPEPETFTPAPLVRGTATLPGPGAEGIKAHQVNAQGKPSTEVKTLPAGAWNLLRAPYDVSRPPAPSAQDKAGRGLGISNPPPVKWGKIFPHFQGNKTEMAERTTQAIRAKMSEAERKHYTAIVDYFGGGGCWGLFHALENFPNVKHLVVNEFDPDRLGKIRLLHEIDGQVAEEAKKILFNDALYSRIKEACAGSSAPVTAANKVEQLFKREITDPRERAVIQAWIDCAHTMLGSQAEATDADPTRVGIEASLAKLREDGRKAKEAADAFKSRQGARIDYVAGDAVANSLKMPHGDNVMAIADPPYYLTADYQQGTILDLEKVPDNWSYRATQDFLHSLVDNGDGIVYTDEAWWFKESYRPDLQTDFFSGGRSKFEKEQEVLLDIINTLDHFDVAGRVVGRQEVLGVHHGHKTDTEAEGGANGNDVLVDGAADGRGNTGDRHSVRRMAAEPEGQGWNAWGDGGSGRPRSGESALAREVIIQDIAASIESAATEITTGATVDTDAISRLARYSVRQVREDRMAEYAEFVEDNAEHCLKTMDDDGLPIPLEMRVDQSMNDIRFSVQMGKKAREEAAAKIRKYMPDIPDTAVEGYTNHIAAFETPKERKAALLWFCKKTILLPEDAPKVTEAIKTAERAKVDPMQYDRPGDILEKFSKFRPKEPPINPDTVPELSDKRDMGNGVTTYLVQDDKAGQLAMRKIINTHWGKDANPWCLLQGDGQGNLSDGSNDGYNAWHYWQHYNALPKRVAFQDGKLLAFMATTKSQKLASLPTRQYDNIVRMYETETGMEAHDKNGDITDAFLYWYNDGSHQNQEWWDRADQSHDGIPMKRVTKGESEYGASTTTEGVELMQDGTEVTTSKKRESIAPDGTRTIEEWDVNGKYDKYERRTRWPSGMMESTATTKKYDYTYFSTVTNNILEIHTLRLSDSTTKEITWEVDYRTTMRLLSGHNGYTLYRYEKHAFRETDPKYTPDMVETWLASAEAALRRGEAVPPLPGAENASTTPRWSVSITRPWRKDFPNATVMTTRNAILEKHGDLFTKAKAGNVEAAADLIDTLMSDKKRLAKVRELKRRHPKAAFVAAVHAEEATGRNKIPYSFAKFIAKTLGIKTTDSIVQTVRAEHSGADAWYRLTHRAQFAGIVERGKEYILVDDHITQGGTLNELRSYIENEGGKVVDVIALTSSKGSTILAPLKGTIDELKTRYPDINRLLREADIAGRVEALTNSEAEYIKTFSPDTFRDRIAQARSERSRRLSGETLGEPPSDSVAREAWSETPEQRETMRNSVFMGARGAVRTDKLDSLVAAMERFKEKHSESYTDKARDDIYINTGWWQGPDGQWRVEIPDMRIKTVDYLVPSTYNGEDAELKPLGDLVSNTRLFKAYPDLKRLPIVFLPDESDQIKGARGVYNGYEILLPYDALTSLDPDDGEIRLTREYIRTLTHEVQHAIQHIEGFAPGGNKKDHGSRNYARLAGEVEARNAAFRQGYPFNQLNRATAKPYDRATGIAANAAPWQTEDVPTLKQILINEDNKMTDVRGNQIERHHVRRGSAPRNTEDIITAYVAAQIIGGNNVSVDDVRKIIGSAMPNASAAQVLERANATAENAKNRAVATASKSVADNVGSISNMLETDRLNKALSDAVTMGAKAASPETGRKLQQAIERKRIRDLQAAEGFTAAEMMAELPISLAAGVLATAELERTPEELARIEEAKKKREEERKKALETEEGAEELADPEAPMRELTEAEKKAVYDLQDRGRIRAELARQEDERRRAEKAKRDAEDAEGGESKSEGGGDAADNTPLLPSETVRRIAPVFESADVFSGFLIEWVGDKTLEKHPELPSTGEMWKSPVAIRELKKTAADILRRLAKDTLGSPSINHARNLVDRAINELECDLETRTFNSVRHKIAHIYEMIWDNAHRITKNELMKELEKTISKLTQKGRFSYTQEEMDRDIPAKIERWAKWVLKYARMGETKLQEEIANLENLTSENPASEDGKMPTPIELAEAADKLAVAKVYGHIKGKTIGEMRDLIDQIAAKLDGERQAFELRRAKIEEANKTIVDALVNAITQGKANRRKRAKAQSKIDRAMAAMISSIDQQMVDLIRFCTDPELRKKALEAIDELTILINEGGNRYRNTLATAQEEIHDGLKACYGSAENGIRHLHEKLPPEIVEQFFRQSSDEPRTYGHLLQLYASCLQRDYAENIHKHGRDEQIAAMEAALTAQDKMFHTWAVNWYKHNRKALSAAVEEVTGLPVISPDDLYVPVRVETEPSGIPTEVVAWSPVPRALSRRVRHGLDFDENAHFLTMVNEQAEIRAQTIGYAMTGIILRDTIASRDVQTAARRNASPSDMNAVILHLRDILAQGAGQEKSVLESLKVLRKWAARFNIAWNPSSALAQYASIPVWANVLLDGEAWGATSVLKAMASAATEEGREAIAELRASDGYRARYKLGWSEEVANVFANPNEPKFLSKLGAAYDKGMMLSQFTDAACSLWIAQGFYRHATDVFVRRGETIEEAKRKALALTWAAVEQTQQSGRTENLSAIQRGRGKNIINAILQFKTAQVLQNSYIIRAIRDVQAGVPGAKGRLARAIFISTVWVPGYLSLKGALWALIMGAKPEPDDEDEMPLWFREMLYSAADGVTAPLFVTSTMAEAPLRKMLNLKSYGRSTGIAALDTWTKLGMDVYRMMTDPIMLEEELTSEKIIDDIWKVVGDISAPIRHTRKAVRNRREE